MGFSVVSAVARINLPRAAKLGAAAGTVKSFVSSEQVLAVLFIDYLALALVKHLFVPEKMITFKSFEDKVTGTLLFSWGVKVFNTKQPGTVILSRVEVAAKSSNERTKV
jgi:hypothetical protein